MSDLEYQNEQTYFLTLPLPKVLRFEAPCEAWLDFIMANRTDKNFSHDYDIVYGPVTLYESIIREMP